MKTSTKKILLWTAAILIALVVVIYFSEQIRVWFMGKLTYLIILAIVFCIGWLLGRCRGRTNNHDQKNIREITKAQSGKK